MLNLKHLAVGILSLLLFVDIWMLYSVWLGIGVALLLIFVGIIYTNHWIASILSVAFILLIGRYLYVAKHADTKLEYSSVLREVSFADDSTTVFYKVGMTETQFSKHYDDAEKLKYYQDKATFLLRYSPDRKDTYSENCYLNTYHSKYLDIFDTNNTILECY